MQTTPSKSTLNSLNRYMEQKYTVVCQFVRNNSRLDVEVHSIVHDWSAAFMMADWLTKSWLEFWQANDSETTNAIVVEVWDVTGNRPEFVTVRCAGRLDVSRIIW